MSIKSDRVDAAMTAYHRPAKDTNGSLDKQCTTLTAALSASDALLRTDEAVERVARAMLHKEGYAVWEKIGRPSQLVWLDRAAVAIYALLEEGE